MSTTSRTDGWLVIFAVVVLLIGTASGNAYVMLGMSLAALVLVAVICRKQLKSGAILLALVASCTVAAITAAAISVAMAMR